MIKLFFNTLTSLILFWTAYSECREVDQMTLEEKVGQLFMVYFDGECVNEHAEKLIRETKIGGIIYYKWANGLRNPHEVQKMSNDLQELANHHIGIPLFISTDQEGGLVARLQEGFTEFPGNAALGRTDQPKLAYEASFFMGQELKAVGVNFNLAPVVDVNNNPENPIIGIRSFGHDEKVVVLFGEQSMKGFKDSGVIPCLKHFPGHGDVAVDSHQALPIVDKSFQEIDKIELFPFKKLSSGAPAMMTAHILFSQIDPENCATLSTVILQDLLRKRLNFQGVLITDSLRMKGVLEGSGSMEEIAIKAFNAGNDILLIGGRDLQDRLKSEDNIEEVTRIYHSMIDAIRDGRISEERVDASVSRILKLKKEAGLFTLSPPTIQDLNQTLQRGDHLRLANEIAYRSVKIQKWDLKHDLSLVNVAIIAPQIVEEKIRETDLIHIGKSTRLLTFRGMEPSEEESLQILEHLEDVDHAIFCSYNSWKMPKQKELLRRISALLPTACIAVRDPQDLEECILPEVQIATFSPATCSLQVAADYLSGRAKPLFIPCEH